MTDQLSAELLELIVLQIDSVELLEVLILLHKHADTRMSASEIDASIRSNANSIDNRLRKLVELGFALGPTDGRYQYMPRDDTRRRLASQLILAYETRRVEVIKLIYTKPMKEIVSFSSAFKFKGGGKNDG